MRTRQAPFARLLACALLALVAYAATAEAVHRHGNLLQPSSAAGATSAGQQSQESSSQNDSLAFGDCLICQLHQQLSGGLFTPVPQVMAPPDLPALWIAESFSAPSQATTPRRGRAPPTLL